MILVVDSRYRSEKSDAPWIQESSFRYWVHRRNIMKRQGKLLTEEFYEDRIVKVRMETWRSLDDFEEFREDICARVIDAVIKHEESKNGVHHRLMITGDKYQYDSGDVLVHLSRRRNPVDLHQFDLRNGASQ